MALCFLHYMCLLYMVLLLQLYLMLFIDLCCYYRMLSIKIDGIYMHCGNVIFSFLVVFLLYIVDHSVLPFLRSGSSCCTLDISFHMLGITWVDGWSTVLAISLHWHFDRGMLFLLFCFILFLLSVSCQSLSFQPTVNDCWLASLGLKLFYANANTCSPVSFVFSSALWAHLSFLLTFECHSIHV